MNVLFLDATHPALKSGLESAGFKCDLFENYSRDDFEKIVSNYDGLIVRSKFTIDKPFLDLAKNLKFIGRVGAGMENINVEYAESIGIKCYNSPEGNRDALGEHALGMLLMLFNNLLRADKEVRNGIWEREGNRGIEIKGRTVGIIGYGNMGGAFAKRLKGFDANIIAYDKYKSNFTDKYVKEVSLEELQEKSDILSIHTPLTEETKYIINDEFIKKFSKPFYFINTARGKVTNTEDLVKNMKSGKVLGVCLDVMEYEKASFESFESNVLPEPFKYLINSDRAVLSPHIAGWTVESNKKLATVLVEKISKEFAK